MYKLIIMGILVLFSLLAWPQRIKADDPVITLDQKFEQVFGSKAHLMKAIAMAESRMEVEQVSYNCMIDGVNHPCRNKNLAWSSDCGVMQVNVKGRECPAHLLKLETNLIAAKKILDEQGLGAWVVYRTGKYKKYM